MTAEQKKKIHIYILTVVIVWGAFLRLYDIGHQSLWIDESYSALSAEKIVEKGIPEFDSGKVYNRGKPHTYIVALMYSFFGANAGTLRIPSSIFGVLTIWLVYLAAMKFIKDRTSALIAAAITAFSYYEIAWSRQIRMYTELQFFVLLAILLFFIYLNSADSGNGDRSRRYRWAVPAGIVLTATICVGIHKIAYTLAVVFLIFGIAYYDKKWFNKKNIMVLAFAMISGLLLVHLLFAPLQLIVRDIYIMGLRNLVFKPEQLLHFILFLFKKYTIVSCGAVIGVAYALTKRDRNIITLAATSLALIILLSFNKLFAIRYIFYLLPLVFIIASYGFSHMLRERRLLYPTLFLTLILFALYGIWAEQIVLKPGNKYFLEYDPTPVNKITWDITPQPDFNKVYEFIEKNRKPDDVFIVAHTAIHHWYIPDSRYYWLAFPFRLVKGIDKIVQTDDNRKVEYYTGVPVINDLDTLQNIMENNHGFVIIDFYPAAGLIKKEYKRYIEKNAPLVFFDQANPDLKWTKVWVSRF